MPTTYAHYKFGKEVISALRTRAGHSFLLSPVKEESCHRAGICAARQAG